MRDLFANLKHFYQCRALWFFYVSMGLFVMPSRVFPRMVMELGLKHSDTFFVIASPFMLAAGVLVCRMQILTASKPFSFILPGHQQVVRKLVFGAGVVAGLLGVCAFLPYRVPPDTPSGRFDLVLCAAFCGSLVVYLVGANLGFSVSGLVIAGLLWAFMGVADAVPNLSGTVEDIIICSPWLITTSGMGIAVVLWLWLGRQLTSLRNVHERRAKLSGTCVRPRRHASLQASTTCELTKATLAGRHKLFLDIVSDPKRTSAAKHIGFALYPWLLARSPDHMSIMLTDLMALGYMLLIWYIPSTAATLLLLLSILAPMDTCDTLPLHSPLLTNGGRRERFFASMTQVIARGSILVLFTILSYLAISLLRPPRPEWIAHLYEEAPNVDIKFIVFVTAVFPIASLLTITVYGKSRLWLAVVLMPLYFLTALPISLLFQFKWMTSMPGVWVAAITILSWTTCTYGVYRIAVRSDLVRR